MIDIENMTLEELKELEAAIAAKLQELEDEEGEKEEAEGCDPDEEKRELTEEEAELLEKLPEDIDKLEELVEKIGERKAKIAARAQKRAAMMKKVARNEEGKSLRKFGEEKMEQKTYGVETKEYRNAWLKKMQGKPLDVEERAMTASAAIPTVTMNKIIHTLELNPLIGAVDVTHIPGNVTYPAENSIADASWVAMGNASTDSADSLQSITLNAYKLIKTVEITADVTNMGVDEFENWLVTRLANKIEKAVDNGIINGGGSTSGECLGIVTSKATQDGTYTKAGMVWSDITKIMGKLGTQYHQNASFLMHRTLFFGEVLGMKDSTGNRVVVPDAEAPCKFTLLGYPVIVDDNCGSEDVFFGDLKQYKFNFAKAPEVTYDDSVAFRYGSRVWRAMALADGKLGDTNAIVRYIRAT